MKEKKGSFLTGILGALLGAIIGTIPAALLYLFADLFLGWAFVLIGICTALGYKLLKGRKNFGFAFVISLLFAIIAPLAFLLFYLFTIFAGEGIPTDEIMNVINSNGDLKAELIKEIIITFAFSIFGVVAVIKPLKAYCVGEAKVNTDAANSIPAQVTENVPAEAAANETPAEAETEAAETTETAEVETKSE